MKNICVVFHSGYGHTTNLANGIVAGIETIEDVTANVVAIDQNGEISEADWQALDGSDSRRNGKTSSPAASPTRPQ